MPDDPTLAERAVVVQLLDRPTATAPSDLYVALDAEVSPGDIDHAVLSLAAVGVLQDTDGELSASPALRRLDALGLIGI
jgi:hypothetical protein